jgi:hypothetical protein
MFGYGQDRREDFLLLQLLKVSSSFAVNEIHVLIAWFRRLYMRRSSAHHP